MDLFQYCINTSFFLFMAFDDFKKRKISNIATGILFILNFFYFIIRDSNLLLSRLIPFGIACCVLLLLYYKTKRIGGGDIKLLAILFFCYYYIIAALICLLAVLLAIILNMNKQRNSKAIPFVPFLFISKIIFLIIFIFVNI